MEQIDYADIMALGFSEEPIDDKVYFNQYGFQYCHITLELTPKLYVSYAKETRTCKLVRLRKKKGGDIENEMPIKNLDHLKDLVHFFKEKKDKEREYFDFTTVA